MMMFLFDAMTCDSVRREKLLHYVGSFSFSCKKPLVQYTYTQCAANDFNKISRISNATSIGIKAAFKLEK